MEIFVAFFGADSAGAVAESAGWVDEMDEWPWEEVAAAAGGGGGTGPKVPPGVEAGVGPSPRGPLSPGGALVLGSPEGSPARRAGRGAAPRPAAYARLRRARTGPAARLRALLAGGGSVPRLEDTARMLLHRNLVARMHAAAGVRRAVLRAWRAALSSAPHRVEARRKDTVDRFLARITEVQRGAAEDACEAVVRDVVGLAFERIAARAVAALAAPVPDLAVPLARTVPAADRGYAGPPRPPVRSTAAPSLRAGTAPRHAAAVARKRGALGIHSTEVISVGAGKVGPLPPGSDVLRVDAGAAGRRASGALRQRPPAAAPSELDEFIRAREAGLRRQLEESQRAAASAHLRRATVKWRGWVPWKRLFLVLQRKAAVARRRHEVSLARRALTAWAGRVPELGAWRAAFSAAVGRAAGRGLLRACLRTWASTVRMAIAWRALTVRLLVKRWHRLCSRRRATLARLEARPQLPPSLAQRRDAADDDALGILCRDVWLRRTLVRALRLWRSAAEREWVARESARRTSLLLSKASTLIAGLTDL